MKRQWIDRDFIGRCDRPRARLRFSSGKIQRPVSSPTQSLWLRRTLRAFLWNMSRSSALPRPCQTGPHLAIVS